MEKTILEEDNEFSKNILKIVKGTIISIAVTLILLLIFSAVLTYTNVSESVTPTVIIAVTGVSILIGSSISTLKIRKNGMIYGALCGLMYMTIIYALSSIENGFLLNGTAFIMMLIAIVMGAVGGIVGVNLR